MILAGIIAVVLSIVTVLSAGIHPLVISLSGFAAFFAHRQGRYAGFLAVLINLASLLLLNKALILGQEMLSFVSSESCLTLLVAIQVMAICIYLWRWAMVIDIGRIEPGE